MCYNNKHYWSKSKNYRKDQRKKHVESMFITNKKKKYPFYYKSQNSWDRVENVYSKMILRRFYYNLQMKESGYIGIKPLKTIMRIFKWYVKTKQIEEGGLKIDLKVFPDFVLTSKPKEMRMGKGKGTEKEKKAFVKKGSILFMLRGRGVRNLVVKKLAIKLSTQIPLKHKLARNFW